jgi:hypothetical protein
MDESDDLVTIEVAGKFSGMSPSAIGYWIVTGQLQATVAAEGRMVSLAEVQRLSHQVNLPSVRRASSVSTDDVVSNHPAAAVGGDDPGNTPQPSVREPVEGPRVMSDLSGTQRDPVAAPISISQLSRFESRLQDAEQEILSLRSEIEDQRGLIEQLRRQIDSAPAAPGGEPSAPVTPPKPAPTEPELTLRLRPVSEEPAAPAGTATVPRNSARELPRLFRDTEPSAPVSSPPADAPGDSGEPT